CVRYGAGDYPGVAVERLGVERVFPVCSEAYRQRHRLRRPEQLTKLALVHHDVLRDHPGRVDWARWFERVGLDPAASRRDRKSVVEGKSGDDEASRSRWGERATQED